MDTGLTIALVLAVIAVGAFVIHRLNSQHADRIARRQYSRRLPGLGEPGPGGPGLGDPGATQPQPVVDAHERHERRD